MNHSLIIRKLAKDLKLAGADDICNKLMIALADIDECITPRADLSYSSIMRCLHKNNTDKAKAFQKCFKEAFDEAFLTELDDVEEAALMQAMSQIDLDDEDLK